MGRSNKMDQQIPDLTGKIIIVTGANSGLGFEATKRFAEKGAEVVLGCRSEEKAQKAMELIREKVPNAKLSFSKIDLSDLASIKEFVQNCVANLQRVDVLVNNAGLGRSKRYETKDGFEYVVGTNHFGPFALTLRLINSGLFEKSSDPRIVLTSSEMHRPMWIGKFSLDDIDFKKKPYQGHKAYGMSKLGNILFTFKLQRELDAAGKNFTVIACHPGFTKTDLNNDGFIVPLVAMDVSKGVYATVLAAVSPNVEKGTYFGPGSCFNIWGYPTIVAASADAQNEAFQDQLWELSKTKTGVSLDL